MRATGASSAPTPNKESDNKEELHGKSDIGENKSEKQEPSETENICGSEAQQGSKGEVTEESSIPDQVSQAEGGDDKEGDASPKSEFQRQISTKSALQLLAEIDEETAGNLSPRSKRALELLDEVDQDFHLPEVLQPDAIKKEDVLEIETKDENEEKRKEAIEDVIEVEEAKIVEPQ